MIDTSDSLVGTLNVADIDNYPIIPKLLEIGSVSPIGLAEAERAASGIRRLRTAHRSTMQNCIPQNWPPNNFFNQM